MLPVNGLFEPNVAVVVRQIGRRGQPLLEGEINAISRAAPVRRLEFTAGRNCARAAMAKLGLPPTPIYAGEFREPCWPADTVGSISHCSTYCVAAVARKSGGHMAIGVDVEEADELDASLVATICTPNERTRLAQAGLSPLVHAKLLFSIKESVFKCQFPVTRAWLEFSDVEVELDLARNSFDAVLLREAGSFPAGKVISGRMLFASGHVLSSAWLGCASVSTLQ